MDIGYLGDFSIYHIRTSNGVVLKASAANSRRAVSRQINWVTRFGYHGRRMRPSFYEINVEGFADNLFAHCVLLSLFVLLPAIIIVRLSLSDAAAALPPYLPAWQGFRLIGDFFRDLILKHIKLF